MKRDVFGEATEDGKAAKVSALWPCVAINQIENSINLAMEQAMITAQELRAPVIFEDENGVFENAHEWEKIYGERFTIAEAAELQRIVYGEVAEHYRRQLIVARECGANATMTDFIFACEAEGLDPLIEGKIK